MKCIARRIGKDNLLRTIRTKAEDKEGKVLILVEKSGGGEPPFRRFARECGRGEEWMARKEGGCGGGVHKEAQ
jgi:hypothetical protein